MLKSIIFIIIFTVSISFFIYNLRKIISNIRLGKEIDRSDNSKVRLKNMIRLAFGQSKMFDKPIVGILHFVLYAGFIIINIEVVEIIIDGIFGTHRFLATILPAILYNFLIASFEWLAVLVLISCFVFLSRRNILRIKRFWSKEMTSWPRTDANLILIFEILLMSAFLLMNAADSILQNLDPHYIKAGAFPVSQYFVFLFSGLEISSIIFIERFCWWFHIIGILIFLNYILFSKHLHIFFAFPSTYYANINLPGKFDNLEAVTKEVKLMMDPNADPFANPTQEESVVSRFGVKDADDLNQIQLLNAYSCTECGRCSSNCPANITGKKLSPRKIMMDTRDRITEIGDNIRKKKKDEKSLLGDYITNEELWACTSCNACTEACPIDLDPLSIILDMRRYLVMEESNAPSKINMMFTNIENNGAPWQFSANDRLNWKDDN